LIIPTATRSTPNSTHDAAGSALSALLIAVTVWLVHRRADPLEQLPRLPQQVPGFGAVAGGRGAAAQAGQRLGLIMGAADGTGEVQCLLVTLLGTVKIAADPVQRPFFVERLGFTLPVAEVAVDAQQ
jgi:hypothetical protein